MAEIHIEGSWATLHRLKPFEVEDEEGDPRRGTPSDRLEECLAFLDPKRFFNPKYKEKNWDGWVRFFRKDGSFMAGYVQRVKLHLEGGGETVKVLSRGYKKLDPALIHEDLLYGIRLWDHQITLARALIAKGRGTGRSPTGSGKTASLAALARVFWEQCGWRTLILVPLKGILTKTYSDLNKFYGGDIPVGIVGDSQREDGAVTVATAQTLIKFKAKQKKKKGGKRGKLVKADPWLRDLVESTDVLILDEVHMARSRTWQEIVRGCVNAKRRYGVSGTPRTEHFLADLRLEGATGGVVVEITEDALIDAGLCAKPKIAMVMSDNASGLHLGDELGVTFDDDGDPLLDEDGEAIVSGTAKYRDAYWYGVVACEEHNATVVLSTRWLIKQGRGVLILCRRKDHFTMIAELLEAAGVRFLGVWGATSTKQRNEAKEAFASKEIDVLLGTTVWDMGEDIRRVGAIVLAEGVKSSWLALQRIGRGMRKDTADVWVVDIVPTSNGALTDHALARCEAYESRGYEVVVVEDWPRGTGAIPRKLLPFQAWDSVYAAQ